MAVLHSVSVGTWLRFTHRVHNLLMCHEPEQFSIGKGEKVLQEEEKTKATVKAAPAQQVLVINLLVHCIGLFQCESGQLV